MRASSCTWTAGTSATSRAATCGGGGEHECTQCFVPTPEHGNWACFGSVRYARIALNGTKPSEIAEPRLVHRPEHPEQLRCESGSEHYLKSALVADGCCPPRHCTHFDPPRSSSYHLTLRANMPGPCLEGLLPRLQPRHPAHHGRAGAQVEPINPTLKVPGTNRLKLRYDELCFQTLLSNSTCAATSWTTWTALPPGARSPTWSGRRWGGACLTDETAWIYDFQTKI